MINLTVVKRNPRLAVTSFHSFDQERFRHLWNGDELLYGTVYEFYAQSLSSPSFYSQWYDISKSERANRQQTAFSDS